MDQGTEIAKFESGLARPPDKVIAEAKIAVGVFKSVLEQKPKKVIINGEQYLEYEDWQTLGEFYRCSAITKDAIPVEIDGVKGAKALANLVDIDTGLIIGGAEAYCMRDEENWGSKPWFQLSSMAQTRAGAKAFRNRLAWVAVLAGYRATPAEEMVSDRTKHWCSEHNTAFFKKGKMKAYAHPIGDTGGWCHEHKDKPQTDAADAEATTPENDTPAQDIKQASTPDEVPNQAEGLLQWIVDNQPNIRTAKTARSWLVSVCKIEDSRIDTEPKEVMKEIAEIQGWKV